MNTNLKRCLNLVAKRLLLLCALMTLGLGGWLLAGEEGIPLTQLRQVVPRYASRPSSLASRHGYHLVGTSHYRVRSRNRKRRVHRASNRRYVQSTPKPRVRKVAGLTIKVFDKRGHPVSNVSMKAVIDSSSGPDVTATKVTNANGNLVLEKVGPLPAAIELDSASPHWIIADDDSSEFLIKPTADSMYYETAKVRPAVLRLQVKGAAGAKLSTPALAPPPKDDDEAEFEDDVPQEVSALQNISDDQELEIPADNVEDDAVPIVLSKDLPGGSAESIVYNYDEDAENAEVTAPPAQLASVKSITINGGLGVLLTDDEIEAKGKEWQKPKDEKLVFDDEDGLNDGSEWWWYQKFGLAVKERSVLGNKDLHVTERIRLLAPEGGNISGIHVGSTVAELREQLGDPQVANAPAISSDQFAPKSSTIDSYLDDGLRFGHDGQNILWIDIARPTDMLLKGATSFAPNERTRVFIADFKPFSGDGPKLNMNSEASFKKYLNRLPSIELVDDKEDADLILSARVIGFTQKKKGVFGSTFAYEYDCDTTLQYDLQDVATGKYLAQNKTLTGHGGASFKDHVYKAILAAIGIRYLVGGKIGDYGPWVIAGGLLYDLKRSVQRAANRCPGISERQVFDQLTQEINNAVNYRAPITAVDYANGLLTLGIGTRDGVHLSTPDRPFEFEITAGDARLLDKTDEGDHADYYSAVVQEVHEDSCVCKLMHVKGNVSKESDEIPAVPAPEVVKALPDAATGVLSARAWTRFAPVEVISDEEIRQSDEEDKKQHDAYIAAHPATSQITQRVKKKRR
jgi:hypothetical protein